MKTKTPLLEFRNVNKTFYIKPTNFLRNFLLRKKSIPIKIVASKNLNFEVNRGETVGLFGPNGSGKSTILRLAAGILQPDTGTVVVRGTVASVIELGSGLHFELTGEENINLYATILGIPHRKIKNLRNKILEFSGVGEFISMPLKYFSTGMRARLATAIALFADTDIILLDEAVTVGDSDFREKFLRMLKKIQKNKAIIFTTHDFGLLQHLSSRIYLLDHGNINNTDSEISIWHAKSLSLGKTFNCRIQTNSMYPLIKKGTAFKVFKNSFSEIKVDDVIAFTVPNVPQVVVHRVAEIHKSSKSTYCLTKGDSSIGYDVWKVKKEDYLGKVVVSSLRSKIRS